MSNFSKISAEIAQDLANKRIGASKDQDAEWQRVYSYIADSLKDLHVLFAKLARLQGDFAGEELSNLEKVSESVLMIGDELSRFSKAFYHGKYNMQKSEMIYGGEDSSPAPQQSPIPQPAPESQESPEIPMEVQGDEDSTDDSEEQDQS